MNLRLKLTALLSFLCLSFASLAHAQISLIRDAQTEKFLRELCQPIFSAAGLQTEEVNIYIVGDDSINAFISGGQNVFINTGLIRKYKTPDALIGVVAHESGHIAAGHLARSSEEAKKAGAAMLLSYILGIGAVVAGSPEAGQGIILGGSQTAERFYMKFTRSQEEAADRHALIYLEKINYPATGLITLLEFFENQLRGYQGQIDEYALSHPISKKRVDYLKNNFNAKNAANTELNAKLQPQMNQVLAKLDGFIDDPDFVIKKYQNKDDNNSKYAKSVAFYRKGKTSQALRLLDEIITKNENDGFLYELKGQILFESGDISSAIVNYNKTIQLLKNQDSSQAKIYFSLAILSLKKYDKDLINLAISRLKEAQIFEKENPFLFKNLSNAYNKIGDEARSYAALAEYNFLIGEKKKALKYATDAKEKFATQKNVRFDLLRLEDLIELVKNDKDVKE